MRGISRETRCEMSKKINIMGICLDNYSVRESLMRLDTYMSSTVLNIIETVTMEQLILAGENPAIKECLEQADLCIIGEREILTETGTDSAQRAGGLRAGVFTGTVRPCGTQPQTYFSACRNRRRD